MGRLRDGFDSPLFRSINEEVTDLFGNEDGRLHRLEGGCNSVNKDPLWDEPVAGGIYTAYKIPFIIQDITTPIDVSDSGSDASYEATGIVTRTHLEKAGVPRDSSGEFVRPGDILETWIKGDRSFWYIIGDDRSGYVNDSDEWLEYVLELSRTNKFVPEREL